LRKEIKLRITDDTNVIHGISEPVLTH